MGLIMLIILKLLSKQNGSRFTYTQAINVNEKVYTAFKRVAAVQFTNNRRKDLIEDGVLTCKFKTVQELSVAIATIEELKELTAYRGDLK